MRKRHPWYSFRLIVPALILLPPLGLILLWKSPRTPRVKAVVSLLLLVVATGAFVGIVKTGMYTRYIESRQPRPDVYNVQMNSRQQYVSKEVLPFERKIFAAVVNELRKNGDQQQPLDMGRDIVDYEVLQPSLRAFRAVGDQYDIDYEDVQKIYHKVSVILQKKMRK